MKPSSVSSGSLPPLNPFPVYNQHNTQDFLTFKERNDFMNLKEHLSRVESGGVTSPDSFLAAGVSAGLKKSHKPDLALLYSEKDCHFAGTFTSNLFPAAPVQLCRDRILHQETVRAVAVNSGIANACTGHRGYRDALKTADMAAEMLHIPSGQVLVSSTGRIGTFLPLDILEKGLHMAAAALSKDGGSDAARAIMTTDTRKKETAFSFTASSGKKVTVGGMTKGAGMIAPHMLTARPHATMLCYLTTDADASNGDLAEFLENAVAESFNCISVDNDMSTNDTCLLLANGASGVKVKPGTPDGDLFQEALRQVTSYLAKEMVRDGEGSSKFVEIEVKGAATKEDAVKCAKAIADSMLCKTAWFGADPNWGRVLAAAGYSGAKFSPENVSLDYNEMPVVRGGMDAGTPEMQLAEILKQKEFVIHLDLGAGNATHTVWTSDITYEYVKINADYHT